MSHGLSTRYGETCHRCTVGKVTTLQRLSARVVVLMASWILRIRTQVGNSARELTATTLMGKESAHARAARRQSRRRQVQWWGQTYFFAASPKRRAAATRSVDGDFRV